VVLENKAMGDHFVAMGDHFATHARFWSYSLVNMTPHSHDRMQD
jgi:hypothetical protein